MPISHVASPFNEKPGLRQSCEERTSCTRQRGGGAEKVCRSDQPHGHASERVYVAKHGKQVAALVSVAVAELLEALEDKYDLAAVKATRTDIAKRKTMPFEQLVKELGL